MENGIKYFKENIMSIYNTEITFICYLRKRLIEEGIIKPLTNVDGLSPDLHMFINTDRYPDSLGTIDISFEKLEHILIKIKGFYAIDLRVINQIISIWSYADETNRDFIRIQDIYEDVLSITKSACDKWYEHIRYYNRMMERNYGILDARI